MDKRFPKQVFKSDIFLRNSMYGIFTFLESVKNVESFNTHHDNKQELSKQIPNAT